MSDGFPHGWLVTRERRPLVPAPYNPDRLVEGSWEDELDTIELPGAFVASSTSTSTRDATRVQILTDKSLFLTNPSANVKAGDRIQDADATYYVQVRPQADVNPFTGWQPVLEIPLEMTEG